MSKLSWGSLGKATLVAFSLALPGSVTAHSAETEKITFVQPSPSAINSFPVYVAIGEGYFKDEGLEVTPESVNGTSPMFQALASGQAQVARPSPGSVLAARQEGMDAIFIYNQNPKSSFELVVPADSAVKDPVELKGQVVGVGTADGAELLFAKAILSKSGLEENKDYTFLPVGDGGPAAAAFQRGDIVAYASATHDSAILNQRGIPLRDITPPEFVSLFGNGYVVLKEYMDANPDVIRGFGRALVRAQRFAVDEANREKVLAHMKAGMPAESEDAEFAEKLFLAVLAKTKPVDTSAPWGYNNPTFWQQWHDNLVATGTLKEPVKDLSSAYTNDFIEGWNAP